MSAVLSVPTTDSHMYQTMHRQPDDLRRLLRDGWGPADEAANLLAGAKRVIVTGVGTSYHAAVVGSWLLRAAGADARAILSADVALYAEAFTFGPDDVAIVMAHSGVKTVSARAMSVAAGAGATVLSVGSLTAEHPGSSLILRTVEREKSAAFTSSHQAAMMVLAQIATALGERTGAQGVSGFRDAMERLPDMVARVLNRQAEVEPVTTKAVGRRIYAAGAGPNAMTALEAVIKVREAAYGWIDALPLEQFLHGPIVAVNAGDLAVLVNVPGRAVTRVGEIAAVLAAIGAELWVVGEAVSAVPQATVFGLPELPELLSPLLAVVPMQILAYQMAVAKGLNPDTFRRDNPTYHTAFGLLKL